MGCRALKCNPVVLIDLYSNNVFLNYSSCFVFFPSFSHVTTKSGYIYLCFIRFFFSAKTLKLHWEHGWNQIKSVVWQATRAKGFPETTNVFYCSWTTRYILITLHHNHDIKGIVWHFVKYAEITVVCASRLLFTFVVRWRPQVAIMAGVKEEVWLTRTTRGRRLTRLL